MNFRVSVPVIGNNYDTYMDALSSAGMEPVKVACASSDPECDGLLLPGGADIDPFRYGEENTASRDVDDELDGLQFAVLKKYIDARRPVLGICRGHQLVNVFFGGTLWQDLPTADAHTRENYGEQFHHVSFAEDSVLMSLYGRRTIVNSTHHQGLKKIGDGFDVIAEADDGTVEAVAHGSLPVIGVQWHPERMIGTSEGRAEGILVFEMFRGAIERSRE